jgi:hypothetical protein
MSERPSNFRELFRDQRVPEILEKEFLLTFSEEDQSIVDDLIQRAATSAAIGDQQQTERYVEGLVKNVVAFHIIFQRESSQTSSSSLLSRDLENTGLSLIDQARQRASFFEQLRQREGLEFEIRNLINNWQITLLIPKSQLWQIKKYLELAENAVTTWEVSNALFGKIETNYLNGLIPSILQVNQHASIWNMEDNKKISTLDFFEYC